MIHLQNNKENIHVKPKVKKIFNYIHFNDRLMKTFIISTISLCFMTFACGQKKQEVQEKHASPAEILKEKLANTVAERKVMFGHHDDPVYGHTWNAEGTSDVVATSGSYPAVMSWDLGGLELGNDVNLDSVPFSRIRQEAIAQDKRGGINTFSWHLYHPLSGNDSWNVSDSLAVCKIVNTPEGKAAYERQLEAVAGFLMSIKDQDGDRIGVIFRPWHEHTGNWFWWGTGNCSAEDYKALWTIMRNKFDDMGVDNVVWAYSPDRCESSGKYMARYPGDEYVDILGADVYHFNGEEGTDVYRQDARSTLTIACDEASRRDKIAAFTETGCESVVIDNWYTSVLLPILKEYPVAYVTVWRNAHDKPQHFYTPYPGHPAESDFKQFTENTSIKVIRQSDRNI